MFVLPFAAVIESGLMDEPCDWEVCTEAATPVTISKPLSVTEKKKKKQRTKSCTDQAAEHTGQRKPEKTPSAAIQAAHAEENQGEVSPAKDSHLRGPPEAGKAQKELQDTLPKIPPLSSFKSCRPRFVTLEEAEQDFHSFITTGLGRSVDVIREFRGQEDGEQSGHRESVTLHDDSDQCLKLRGKQWKPDFSHLEPVPSSSSQSDMDDGGAATKSVTETGQASTVAEPKAESETSTVSAHPLTSYASSGRTLSQAEDCGSFQAVKPKRQANQTAPKHSRRDSRRLKRKIRKQNGKNAEKLNGGQRGRHEGRLDEQEQWSAETYWREIYHAWNDYYASISPFKSQGYQSCYSAAHSWMAAYRMNAVYIEELLKH